MTKKQKEIRFHFLERLLKEEDMPKGVIMIKGFIPEKKKRINK